MTLDEIKSHLPHRDPFLWLDEVVTVQEESIHARKFLNEDLGLFQGHYPDFPILPGVIQCEMAFQAAALLVALSHPVEDDRVPVVVRLNNTQFRSMVRPNDLIDIHVEITQQMGEVFFFKGKLLVGDRVATRLEFATTVAPVPVAVPAAN